ncbi:hypothetical protein [Enterocloster citroniae]|uniref:Phosphatidylinositol kinase n=2 Tax=Enterocloster citroniae TaxID=358743 RepID=A0ABV2G637_9FIRM|nr:hypothetical protein [Enterocloster citroniae]KMW09486.1 hypothetical protein HMPREF9470_05634 [[Clostridium] citroniae WAL-19142]
MANTLDFKQMEQWGLNDYAQFFDESHKKFGQKDSELYQNVKTQFNAFLQLQNTPITSDVAAELLSAGQKLADACSAYIEAIGDRRVYTGTGQKRVEVIKNLPKYFQNLCSEKQLERLREPLILNANAGKTLNQLNIEPAAHIHEAAFENQVGGNASERYQVTYQDKRGFFTPKEYVNDRPAVIDEMVNAERNPDHKKVLEANKEFLKENAEGFQAKGVDATIRNELDLMKYWVSLPENTEAEVEKKKIFARLITGRKEDGKLAAGRFDNMKKLIDSYRADLEMLSDADRKDTIKEGNTFRECLNAYRDSNDYEPLSKCSEMIAHYAETRKPSREALEGIEAGKTMFERYLYESAAVAYNNNWLEAYQNKKQLLVNPDVYEKAMTIMKKANMAALPLSSELGEMKEGDELSGRNVASSRMAEFLGVGNLLAHSEKMTVQIGSQEVEGCFMEFAEGVDLRNGKDAALEQINQIRFENSPGFIRDACNLEVLDYLCAQADRHGGNIFLKLSEPQADGTREILGLQGIDNDLSFSSFSKYYPDIPIAMKQGQLQDLCFISENLAKNILATDRSRLQFVLGDILREDEIDALDIRMTQMKDHIRNNMIQVKDDEWALDRDPSRKLEQALAADPDKLLRYQQGVRSLNEGLNPDLPQKQWIHKNSDVGDEIQKAQERYRSQQAERAAEAVQAQTPETVEREQVQPERTENPAANRQVVRESLNMWLKEEARSKGGPKAEMPQKSREIELGAHRRGPRK